MKAKNLITYGEAYTSVKFGLELVGGVWRGGRKQLHHPRMNEQEAGEYYTIKINKAMGWEGAARTKYYPKPTQCIKDFDIIFPKVLKKAIRDNRSMIKREAKKNKKLLLEIVA